MSFKIDHREGKLKECFGLSANTYSECITYENLAHGDIQILYKESPVLLFERKTLSDLIASITDGRYKNQKAVLLQSGYSTSQMYYIIEGQYKWSDQGKDMPMLKGSVINTLMRDKIGIFYTRDVKDTMALLCEIFQRVQKDPTKYIRHTESSSSSTVEDIEKQIVVLSQNDKITPSICYLYMLQQVPGISTKSANAISLIYPNMKTLIKELGSLTSEDQKEKLSAIKVNGRKISSKIVDNLVSYLFC